MRQLVHVLDDDGPGDGAREGGLGGVGEEVLLQLVHDVALEVAQVDRHAGHCMQRYMAHAQNTWGGSRQRFCMTSVEAESRACSGQWT